MSCDMKKNIFLITDYCSSQPSQTWSKDQCTKYDCKQVNNEFVVSVQKTTCPPFDPNDCIPVSTIL